MGRMGWILRLPQKLLLMEIILIFCKVCPLIGGWDSSCSPHYYHIKTVFLTKLDKMWIVAGFQGGATLLGFNAGLLS